MHEDALLRDFLIDAGLASRSQIDAAVRAGEGKSLSRSLIESGVLGEDELRRAAAHALGVPFVVLERHAISPEAMVLIPEPLSRARNVLAFNLSEAGVEVAVLDLADLEAVVFLKSTHKILPRLTSRESLRMALLHYQKHLKEKFGEMLKDGMHLAEALIKHALYSRAGGVHVDLHTTGTLVRYQIDHTLQEAMRLPEQAGRTLVDQLKSFAGLLPVRRPQEGKFKMDKDGETLHVHVSAVPTESGERVSLRLGRGELGQRGYTLEALGFHGEGLAAIRQALARREGLVVIAGPEGAGKTTVAYTLLDLLQAPHLSLVTVEASVGHRLPHAMQIETSGTLSAGTALRAALRHDPDVVLAEIVDKESAALAVSAASRGALVIATVDAAGAAGGIAALRDAGAPPALLASALSAAIGLACVRRLGTKQFHNRQKLLRAQAELLEGVADFGAVLSALKEENIVDPAIQWKDVTFANPVPGSDEPTGYRGFIGLQEVLVNSSAIKALIREGAPAEEVLKQAREEGMSTIMEDGLFKAVQGLTSIEEVFSA